MLKIHKEILKRIRKKTTKLQIIDILGIGIFFIIISILAIFFLRKSSFVYLTILVSKDKYSFTSAYYYKPPDWYLENLKIGMINKDILGKSDLELVDMYYYPTAVNERELYLTLKVKTVFNRRTKQHSYEGQPLLIGEGRVFKLDSVYISGNIQEINNNLDEEKKTKTVVVTGELEGKNHETLPNFGEVLIQDGNMIFMGIKKYLADQINKDLTVVNSKKETVAKITNVEKNTGYREFIYNNSYIKKVDPDRQIVRLKVELTLDKVNEKYLYMKTEQILIGKKIQLPFNNFVVYLTIEEIEQSDIN